MSEAEHSSFDIGPMSPERQEELARHFTPCASPDVRTEAWVVHVEGPVRLTIPPEFALAQRMDDSIVLWHAPDETLLLLTLHTGDGRENTTIALDGDLSDSQSEPTCRIRCAGRDAMLHRWSYTSGGRRLFSGRIDVGVGAGIGFGLAFLSSDRVRGDEFVRIAELVTVEDTAGAGGSKIE